MSLADQGDDEARQAFRQRPQDGDAVARPEPKHPYDERGADHRNQNPGYAFAPLEQQDGRERPGPDQECREVGLSLPDPAGDRPKTPQRPFGIDREPEELGKLADEHSQSDTVHVTVADRLGEQFGNEAETPDAHQDKRGSGDKRHHAGQRDRANWVASRKGHNDPEDDGCERRVRTEDENPAGTEQRVSQQRNDRRVEAIDAGQTRCHRIGYANRHQHRRQDKARGNVLRQPGAFISKKGLQPLAASAANADPSTLRLSADISTSPLGEG